MRETKVKTKVKHTKRILSYTSSKVFSTLEPEYPWICTTQSSPLVVQPLS